MTTYERTGSGEIEIDFHGKIPNSATRTQMKSVKYRWNPTKMVWWARENDATLAMAKQLCGEAVIEPTPVRAPARRGPRKDYALKLKIGEIVSADRAQFARWGQQLEAHVNAVMGEDNAAHAAHAVGTSQVSVWMDCFQFIAANLAELSSEKQEFELIFEYSLPGTVHERPDVLLLTAQKVISMEFKKKRVPQMDDNRDDVAQAIRYRDWLENHHQVTKTRELAVKSYLVCTHPEAASGHLRGIEILTQETVFPTIDAELDGETKCDFTDEWLASPKTEMPDMLRAIEIMYREGRMPYISDVNEHCLKKVQAYIDDARAKHRRVLILINGVPGAGKTAIGQCVVYEENQNGAANAVYLSGNGPLVEVLQYQINQVGGHTHMAENAIQGMKDFKSSYFSSAMRENKKVPEWGGELRKH